MARHVFHLVVIAVLIGAGMAVALWISYEDHRVTYDKEGGYLPIWSLKDLAVAMHEYHEKHGRLPPAAICGENGKPLLSWRVLILPHLKEEELFRQFKLDEQWDSPHNVKLLPKMPWVYSPIDRNPPQEPYTTLFQVFVGKGTPFEGRDGCRFKDIPRMSHTVLIVEGAKSVFWTKPEDISYDENASFPELGAIFPGRFHIVMADGVAMSLRKETKEEDLRAAVLRNGDGEWPWKK